MESTAVGIVGVPGGRGLSSREARLLVDELPAGTRILTGGACRRVEAAVVRAARASNRDVRILPPGPDAYPQILSASDRLVIFWDGRCRPTQVLAEVAEALGKAVQITPAISAEQRVLRADRPAFLALLQAEIQVDAIWRMRNTLQERVVELQRYPKGSPDTAVDGLIRCLWSFIEDVGPDDPERTDKFFKLREVVRDYFEKTTAEQNQDRPWSQLVERLQSGITRSLPLATGPARGR